MYDEEPDFSDNPILYAVWATVEREIDLSVKNRKRFFATDQENEKYQAIIQAVAMNPEASLRKIAKMTSTDKNMVARVKRKYQKEIDAFASDLSSRSVSDSNCTSVSYTFGVCDHHINKDIFSDNLNQNTDENDLNNIDLNDYFCNSLTN